MPISIRLEWGEQGIAALEGWADAFVIIDVLSFTTCVETATARGALVYPYRWKDLTSFDFARAGGAVMAVSRGKPGYSLSPLSLVEIIPGTRLVLPSPNGSTLSLATGGTVTLAGCLRNATALGLALARFGRRVALIPGGERWKDGSLRPALEDWLGAGAIAAATGEAGLSPEARAAVASFQALRGELEQALMATPSGQEISAKGFGGDVRHAAQLDASACLPLLTNGAYRAAEVL